MYDDEPLWFKVLLTILIIIAMILVILMMKEVGNIIWLEVRLKWLL